MSKIIHRDIFDEQWSLSWLKFGTVNLGVGKIIIGEYLALFNYYVQSYIIMLLLDFTLQGRMITMFIVFCIKPICGKNTTFLPWTCINPVL